MSWSDQFEALKKAEKDSPYQKISRTAHELRERFHRSLVAVMEGPLNREIQKRKQENCEEKQDLLRWLNPELRSLGLAIKCPKTGRPGMLQVDSGYPGGRFVLELLDRTAGKRRSFSSVDELPEFEFCPHPVRREPLSEYWAKRASEREHRR